MDVEELKSQIRLLDSQLHNQGGALNLQSTMQPLKLGFWRCCSTARLFKVLGVYDHHLSVIEIYELSNYGYTSHNLAAYNRSLFESDIDEGELINVEIDKALLDDRAWRIIDAEWIC